MPAPGVTTIIDDQSDIRSLTSITEDTTDRPIFMVASSADKGPEEWKHKFSVMNFLIYTVKLLLTPNMVNL